MALDLFLGIIKKNWARDAAAGSPQAAAPPAALVLTADEKDRLARIATLKMRAESGDRKSRKQWKRLARKANALRAKARKGDPRASRMIAVLDQSGLLGSVQKISGDAEPRDQDIVEKLILRAGNATGWPTMISRDRYADYERRAGQGDQRSREVMAILTRYINAGKVKVSDGMKSQISRYPIGASLCADDLEAAADGGSCERAALARRLGVRTARSNVGDRQSDAFALQIATAPTTAALFSPHTAARADSSPKAPPKVLADPGGIADFLHDKQIIDAQAKKEADESDKRYSP